MRYSQNLEQDYITGYFAGRTGKFIDIGAFDALKLSNTRALYEAGWSGILVEPAPINYQRIVDVYKDEPRIQVLNFAVGTSGDSLKFYDSGGDAVSTSVHEHKVKWEGGGVKYMPIIVRQVNVKEFFDTYGTADFISIDTEATNMEVFRAVPDYVWQQAQMICIEHDNCEPEIEARLYQFGFKPIYHNAENLLLAK